MAQNCALPACLKPPPQIWADLASGMVLLGRIELPTSALPRMRSTTELQQHTIPLAARAQMARRAGARYWPWPLALSSDWLDSIERLPMPEKPTPSPRDQRLAAALRENLKRRKDQARAADAVEVLPKGEQTS